jgi:hypothetical protein
MSNITALVAVLPFGGWRALIKECYFFHYAEGGRKRITARAGLSRPVEIRYPTDL